MTEILKSEPCKCFDEYMTVVKDKLADSLAETAIDIEAQWNDQTWILGGDYSPVNPKVKFEYRKIKKGGELAKAITKDTMTVAANFCCFCGRKYKKGEK